MSNIEQTLSIIKPDAVERNLEGQIKEIFIRNGFIRCMKQSHFITNYAIIYHLDQ